MNIFSRYFYIGLGWICVGIAFIGIFTPGIPTTPLLLVALWAFAKSSKKLHRWLINHKRFGPILKNWEKHKVVPKNAKIIMVIFQIFAVIMFYSATRSILFTSLLFITLVLVAWYVISLPSSVPSSDSQSE
ncbi:MAG: Inner membrane protein YbaN [Alphaproteobacteria bacterium MarineAlpha5_Bin11]|nr:hypothetical protein [Pelagibacteraceae bacterium]PPR44046.1 MAG: Inner membrane protein YbaN [Alphaproteobacteria bacterium MarineAlpha5_Bin11]PPR51989.1 MAG: Inner membrane protein YbaN [Alphaproteobacteria bacterium MarineAlpha5_Bin10]|tara:strand:- start:341 stop:733 length:393 start_codon:yes stop_codon:yes gene_type:complete